MAQQKSVKRRIDWVEIKKNWVDFSKKLVGRIIRKNKNNNERKTDDLKNIFQSEFLKCKTLERANIIKSHVLPT